MNVWPVVKREARESSHRPATYFGRGVALVVVGSVGVFASLGDALMYAPGQGGWLFGALHATVFLSTWVLVPFMVADCLSRERREGTLGLLFLTPLSAMDIVLAKLVVHGLRGLTLLLAVLPLFTVPFLIGGVVWHKVAAAAFHNFSALALALAAGMAASSTTKQWRAAMVRSACLAVLMGAGYVYLVGLGAGLVAPLLPGTRFGGSFGVEWSVDWWVRDEWLRTGWSIIMGDANAMRAFGLFALNRLPLGIPVPLVGAAVITAAAFAMLWIASRMAARTIRLTWQEHPPSELRVAVERQFTTPVVGRQWLRRWLTWTLNRNPVGWLEQRSWSGRMVMFGWLAVVIGVLSGVAGQIDFWLFANRRYRVDWIQVLVVVPLLISMAATSAGSFRRERESGVLELLLVSPIREWELVWGRLRGLYAQFLPAVVALVVGWSFLLMLPRWVSVERLAPVLWFVVWAAAVPCVGLYCSLRHSNFMIALLTTLLLAWGVPVVLGFAWAWFVFIADPGAVRALTLGETKPFQALVVVILAGLAVQQLVRRLERRRFNLSREVT